MITTNEQKNELSLISTQDLKAQLAKSLDITVRHLVHLAEIWRELESRGEDLSDLRHGIMSYLPLIAKNKMNPYLIVNYAGQKTLLSALSRLDIQAQAEIAKNGHVITVRLDEHGNKTEVVVKISELSAVDVYQVFSEEKVRSPDEQFKFITLKNARLASPGKTEYRKARRVRIDRDSGTLLVSNSAADINRVIRELSDYYKIDLAELIRKEKNNPTKNEE